MENDFSYAQPNTPLDTNVAPAPSSSMLQRLEPLDVNPLATGNPFAGEAVPVTTADPGDDAPDDGADDDLADDNLTEEEEIAAVTAQVKRRRRNRKGVGGRKLGSVNYSTKVKRAKIEFSVGENADGIETLTVVVPKIEEYREVIEAIRDAYNAQIGLDF